MAAEQLQAPQGLEEPEGDAQCQARDGRWYTYQDLNIANRLFLEDKFQVDKIQFLFTEEKKKNALSAATPRTKIHDDILPVPQVRRCSKRERTNPKRLQYEVLARPKSKRSKVENAPRGCEQAKDCEMKAVKSSNCTTKKAAESSNCTKEAGTSNTCTKRGVVPSPSFKRLMPLIVKMRGRVCDSGLVDCTNFLKGLVYSEKKTLLPPGANPSVRRHAKNSTPRKGSDPHSRMICAIHELACLLDASGERRRNKTLGICENYFLDLINKA